MTIKPEVLDALVAAGATAEMIAAAVKADMAEQEARKALRRAKNAERQRRYRARNAMSRVTERSNALQSVTFDEIPLFSKENDGASRVTSVTSQKEKAPHTPQKENIPPHSPTGNVPPCKPTPRDELARVLDAVHTQAVLEHRQRIRKPLTAHAAKLLAGKFAKCADPNAAADAMIANGWQGFEPEWLENRSGAPPNAGWRKNGVGYYLKPGSEPFEAHKTRAKAENNPRYWDFIAAEKSGCEVHVETLWPGGKR